jgi:hypothetical protein
VRTAAACVLAAILVGCGSSGPKPLAKPAWIARADAVCAQSQSSIRALGTPADLAAITTYGTKVGDILEQEIAQLRALPPPKADRATIDRMLTEAQRGVTVARHLAALAQSGDASAVQQYAASSSGATAEAGRLAKAYGLRVCGQAAD